MLHCRSLIINWKCCWTPAREAISELAGFSFESSEFPFSHISEQCVADLNEADSGQINWTAGFAGAKRQFTVRAG